jgi:hypothetical protein
MANFDEYDTFPGAVMICTPDAIIAYMNAIAETRMAKHGGRALIGSNLLDCHPSPAREKLELLMRERRSNVYTSEKDGVKRLVYQSPCYQDEAYVGYAEFSFEVPLAIPNFLRT